MEWNERDLSSSRAISRTKIILPEDLWRTWDLSCVNVNVVFSTQDNELKSNAHLRKHPPKDNRKLIQMFTVSFLMASEGKHSHIKHRILTQYLQNNHWHEMGKIPPFLQYSLMYSIALIIRKSWDELSKETGWLILKDTAQPVSPSSAIRSGKLPKPRSIKLLEFRLQSPVWANSRDFILLLTVRNQLGNADSCAICMYDLFTAEGVLFCEDNTVPEQDL